MFNLDEKVLSTFLPSPGNQNQKDIQDGLLRYFTLQKTYDLEKDSFDYLTGHQSGAPRQSLNDSQQLNQVEDSDSPNILAALGINFEKQLQLKPRSPRGSKTIMQSAAKAEGLLPFLKEAHYVGSGGGASALRRALRLR